MVESNHPLFMPGEMMKTILVRFSAFSQLFLGLVTAEISIIFPIEIINRKVFRNRS
jgi:hypothetical protein